MYKRQVDSQTTIDAKTDVWALGAILYFLLFNKSPFEDAAAQGSIELAVQNGVYDLPQERPVEVCFNFIVFVKNKIAFLIIKVVASCFVEINDSNVDCRCQR